MRAALVVVVLLAGSVGSAAAQVRIGGIAGFSLGQRDVEKHSYVDPNTGATHSYTWWPDSAVHVQGGAAIEFMRRNLGLRTSLLYMEAGIIDVTDRGRRILACGDQVCPDDFKYNPYPGRVARYLATDVDIVARGWRAGPEFPIDLFVIAGGGVRRRLSDPAVRDLFEDDDRWTLARSLGIGFHVAVPRAWNEHSVFFLEFRNSTGMGPKGGDRNIGGINFRTPNQEARNMFRFGFMY